VTEAWSKTVGVVSGLIKVPSSVGVHSVDDALHASIFSCLVQAPDRQCRLGRFRAYRGRLLCRSFVPNLNLLLMDAMRNILERSRSSYVTALFADRALFFALPKGATFEDLAERLVLLDGRAPSAVTVKLDA
jgi:hypothetical protein